MTSVERMPLQQRIKNFLLKMPWNASSTRSSIIDPRHRGISTVLAHLRDLALLTNWDNHAGRINSTLQWLLLNVCSFLFPLSDPYIIA